jgi:predicted metal-dependent phosphoesterase TrpH
LSASGLDLQFVPGIEMNTEVEETEVHILGYFIDYQYQPLLLRLEQIKEARMDRAQKMVHRLKSMGMSIQFEQVEKLARGDIIGRPHVAQPW